MNALGNASALAAAVPGIIDYVFADGALVCGTVQCPWHGSQFDVSSGEVKQGPAEKKIRTYTVAEHDGRLWLKLPRRLTAA